MAKHLPLAILCLACLPVFGVCPALAQTPAEEASQLQPLDGSQPALVVEVESLARGEQGARTPEGTPTKARGWVARVHIVNRAVCDWTAVSQLTTALRDDSGRDVGTFSGALYDCDGLPQPMPLPMQANPNDFWATLRFSSREGLPPPTALHLALLRYRAQPVYMTWNTDGGPLQFPLKDQSQGVRVTVPGLSVEDVPVLPDSAEHEPHAVFRVTFQRWSEDIHPRPFATSGAYLGLHGADGKQLTGKSMTFGGRTSPAGDGFVSEDYTGEIHFDGIELPVISRIGFAFKDWERLPSLFTTCPLPEPSAE